MAYSGLYLNIKLAKKKVFLHASKNANITFNRVCVLKLNQMGALIVNTEKSEVTVPFI